MRCPLKTENISYNSFKFVMMKRLKLNAAFLCFSVVMILGSCKQVQTSETIENPTLEQNIMLKEFIDYIRLLETTDSIPHYYVIIGISPVAYKLDKQNPATADFIQLIKDTEESNVIKPLKATIDESEFSLYITKVMKVSKIEEKEWRESPRGKLYDENANTIPKK